MSWSQEDKTAFKKGRRGILQLKKAPLFFFLQKLFSELNKDRPRLVHRAVTHGIGNRVHNSVTALHGVGHGAYYDEHFVRYVDVE